MQTWKMRNVTSQGSKQIALAATAGVVFCLALSGGWGVVLNPVALPPGRRDPRVNPLMLPCSGTRASTHCHGALQQVVNREQGLGAGSF